MHRVSVRTRNYLLHYVPNLQRMSIEPFRFDPKAIDDEIMDTFFGLGFDFSSDQSDASESVSLTSEETSLECTGNLPSVKVIKSSSSNSLGSKKRAPGSRKLRDKQLTEKAEKKASVVKLYAFPSFDRSDSLIFLPTSLCRLLNSGNIPELSKLLRSYFAKTCTINMSFWDGPKIDVNILLRMYAVMLEVHPDNIQVAQNIKVDGNKVTASIYAKHTDCRAIHEAVSRTIKDPYLSTKLIRGREEHMQRALQDDPRPPEEMQRFQQMAASNDDLVLYLHLEVEYTIDDLTKKVSQFSINGKITSMELAKKNVNNDSITEEL